MASRRVITILGSTGSIGRACLSIIRENPERFSVFALAGGSNVDALVAQAKEFRPSVVGIADSSKASELSDMLRASDVRCPIAAGEDEIAALAAEPAADMVVGAIVGIAGLPSVYAAVRAGKKVALANKESLVCAGELLTSLAARSGGFLIPVDSEHSALFQCLQGNRQADLSKLVLTASGGPFLDVPLSELSSVTPEQALKHPRWKMGAKVTIDSSTMFNKALEIIEAHWLFGVPEDQIDVVVHPESIVHSLVSFNDGSSIAQLSHPDMRGPISYALGYPERRVPGAVRQLDLSSIAALHFRTVDPMKFPAVGLARKVLQQGGGAGVVFNGANEAAVERFLTGEIGYLSIFPAVEAAFLRYEHCRCDTLESILALDREVRTSLWA